MLTSHTQVFAADDKNKDRHYASIIFICRINFLHPDICPSLLPFILIRHMASNYAEHFIKYAIEDVLENPTDLRKTELTTSCINTAGALSVLLFGRSNAKKHLSKINRFNVTEIRVAVSGVEFDYKIRGLVDRHPKKYLDKFFQHTKPIIENIKQISDAKQLAERIQEEFRELKYGFNGPIIDDLNDEILNDRKKINERTSIIYIIGIRATRYVNQSFKTGFEHIFMIEQFFSPVVKKVRYRLYQSWIGKVSLLKDITKRSYDHLGENAMDLCELDNFFSKLRRLYCNVYVKDRSQAGLDCFGYEVNNWPLLFFTDNTLAGISVKYLSQTIDPEDCIKNISEFITDHEELRAFFQR